MTVGFLSRVALRRDASVQALAGLLVPQGEGRQHGAAHHLLWVLFGDDSSRIRDFLWRQTEPGHFMILSAGSQWIAIGCSKLKVESLRPN